VASSNAKRSPGRGPFGAEERRHRDHVLSGDRPAEGRHPLPEGSGPLVGGLELERDDVFLDGRSSARRALAERIERVERRKYE
jgi:hypothetical protein